MTIGEVARRSGVPAKTIRYYESIGLVRPAERADNGYRVYGEDAVRELRFIGRCRDLGFPLDDVTALLALWRDKERCASDVKDLALRHADHISAKIRELEALRAHVLELAHTCHGMHRPDCPILEELESP